jgi:DNA-binding response OmpR family regulator
MATILVIDDERAIRLLVTRALERERYQVIACSAAEDAMEVPGPVDLMIVDLMLPGMNGRQLVDVLRVKWPSLPVIMMSGYMADHATLPDPPSLFLQKPMLPSALVDAVKSLIT